MHKILVVDDDNHNRMVVVTTLEATQDDYEIISAVDGMMALTLVKEFLPDLILMDWDMPRMNGLEALRELKTNPATKYIPVIMYTGIMTASESLEEALELGAIDFLRKPVENIELIARIKSTISHQKSIAARIQAEKDKTALLQELKEQELKYKTKELTDLSIQIETSNSFLTKLSIALERSLKEHSPKLAIEKIVRELKYRIDSEEDWQKLQERLNKIHKGFLTRLSTQYPSLTRGELKLCIFIRLGLNRSEIAKVMYNSVDTIKKNRSIVRKKLELSSSIPLNFFLEQI